MSSHCTFCSSTDVFAVTRYKYQAISACRNRSCLDQHINVVNELSDSINAERNAASKN